MRCLNPSLKNIPIVPAPKNIPAAPPFIPFEKDDERIARIRKNALGTKIDKLKDDIKDTRYYLYLYLILTILFTSIPIISFVRGNNISWWIIPNSILYVPILITYIRRLKKHKNDIQFLRTEYVMLTLTHEG